MNYVDLVFKYTALYTYCIPYVTKRSHICIHLAFNPLSLHVLFSFSFWLLTKTKGACWWFHRPSEHKVQWPATICSCLESSKWENEKGALTCDHITLPVTLPYLCVCVCVCVRACVRACVRPSVRACARICIPLGVCELCVCFLVHYCGRNSVSVKPLLFQTVSGVISSGALLI